MLNAGTYKLSSGWFRVALFNFLVAASIGLLLRYAFVNEVKWLNYKAFQNAHSSLALLGWGYQAISAFLIAAFLPEAEQQSIKYRRIFIANQLAVLLLAFNFIFLPGTITANILQALFSVLSFVFIIQFIRDINRQTDRHYESFGFVKVALIFLAMSFAGLYCMDVALMVSGMKKVLFYYLGTQFFLHFQYNGWLTFSVIALFFRVAEQNSLKYDRKKIATFRYLMLSGVVLTYFLSLYWGDQNVKSMLVIASAGGLIQLFAVIITRTELMKTLRAVLQKTGPAFRILLTVSVICFILKIIMQVIIMHPFIASLAFTIRNYVISYIHLIFIGLVSLFLFGWALHHRYITVSTTVKLGIASLITGFIFVELVLVIQGTLLWLGKGFIAYYYLMIFSATVLLPAGLLLIGIKTINSVNSKTT